VPRAEMTIGQAVGEMLGEAAAPRDGAAVRPPGIRDEGRSLRLEGIGVRGRLEALDLSAASGEVVGLAGLDGSGASAVFDVLFGRTRPDEGTCTLPDGRALPRSMTAAVRAGVAFVPADRKALGVMLDKPVWENVATVRGGPLKGLGVLPRREAMRERATHWGGLLSIKMASPDQHVGDLSGGNQQKVVLAKWLEADPQVVLLQDPTRGVDIGAKAELHSIVARTAAEGRVVLVTSTDLEELAGICDRVVVFFQGRACAEVSGAALTEHGLLEAINTGVLPHVVPVAT